MNIVNLNWLVVWNMFFSSIWLGIVTPTDELIFFRGIQTTNQMMIFHDFTYETW